MRDIKFRGKDYTNKWRIGDFVQERWGKGILIMIHKNKRAWSVLEDTVGQYTGRKDKNGKEIYEGDIIELTNGGEIRIGKIIYEYSGFTIDVTNMNKPYGRVEFSMLERYIEVIGNIYDNPDLLKEEN